MKHASLPLILVLSLFAPAQAQTVSGADPVSAKAGAPLVTGQVRPGWRTDAGTRIVGVEFRLAPGWKTYWRSPGDAGIPPQFDWSRSDNVRSARIIWPRPEVFDLNGLRSIGYHDRVVLPVEVTPRDPARPLHLRADVDLGVCRDVCVPAELRLDASMSGAGAPDGAIRSALATRASTAGEAGLRALTCEVEPIRDGLRVRATMSLPPQGKGVETVVFEPADPGIWVSEAKVRRDGTRLTAEAEMVDATGSPFALDRSGLMVTVLGADRSVEHRGCPAP